MTKAMRKALVRYHRWLGLAAIPFVVILAVTGLYLARTDALQLDERYVTDDWMLAWYGMAPSEAAVHFAAADTWVTWQDGVLYLDGQPVLRDIERPVGAAGIEGLIVVATARHLYLLTRDGQLVEKSLPMGLAADIQAIASDRDTFLLARAGDAIYRSDSQLSEWQNFASASIAWSAAAKPPPAVTQAVATHYRGPGLTWERVLLDLHSGQLLGAAGPYLMDAAAILLLLLSATGVYNWLRRR